MTDKLTHGDLAQFTGTDTWFRHGLARKVLYTQGVQYMAEQAGAYWLVDKIAILNGFPAGPHDDPGVTKLQAEPFQAWKLKRDAEGDGAWLTVTDGGKAGGDPVEVYRERIEFTDFPLDEIDLWVEVGECPVILLPSEH